MLKQGSAKNTSKSTREDQQKQPTGRGMISGPTGRSPGTMQPEELGQKELGGKLCTRLGDLWAITTYK